MPVGMEQMRPLRDYLDYREFIRDWYAAAKATRPLFSLRAFGLKTGLDASLLHRILRSERHLTTAGITAMIRFFGFAGDDAQYFRELVDFNRARSDAEVKRHFENLQVLRGIRRRQIAETRYWEQWWIPAVRSYLSCTAYRGDGSDLAGILVPAITPEQGREAIEILAEIGLVRRDESGVLSLSDSHIESPRNRPTRGLREYHRQAVDLARRAVDAFPVEERYLGTLTMAVDAECREDIVEMIREFRSQVRDRVDECRGPDRVLQLNFQLFPIAHLPPEGREGR